jgi:hypothetical protein
MHRLESATTSVNAAWHYLLENKASFSSRVNTFSPRALQKAKFKPSPPIESKVKILSKKNIQKSAKTFLLKAEEKISSLLRNFPKGR